MIGSLADFINVQQAQCFNYSSTQPLEIFVKAQKTKIESKNYTSALKQHQPQDKSEMLSLYDKRHHSLSSNKEKRTRNSVKSNPQCSKITKKYSYIDHTFFINHRIKDEISVSNLNNNHSLLKAIVKTDEAQANKRNKTVFDESFQRIKLGFSSINVPQLCRPLGYDHKPQVRKISSNNKDRVIESAFMTKCKVNKNKIHFEKCKRWAQKHGMVHGQSYYEKASKGPQHQRNAILAANQQAFQQTRKCLIKQINQVLTKFRNVKSRSSVKTNQ